MAQFFNLDFTLDYNMNTPYRDILWKGEWIRGFTVSFKVTITNNAGFVFPGTLITARLQEHSSLRSTDLEYTFNPVITVPNLEPGAFVTSVEYEYLPKFEGVCEIMLESETFKRKEIIISGSLQKTLVQNRISCLFSVVRWQELEIIQLLRKLLAKSE